MLPWQVPLPYGTPTGVAERGPSGIAYADGSHLLLWDATAGIVSDLEPLGAGVPIDVALSRWGTAILAGRDAAGIVVATVSIDVGPSGTLCSGGAPLPLSSTAGLTPLALLPLPNGRIGVLTNDSPDAVRLLDVDGPTETPAPDALELENLPLPVQSAWLDDDILSVFANDGLLHYYRLPMSGGGPGTWGGTRILSEWDWIDPEAPPAGDLPISVVRSGEITSLVALESGRILTTWGWSSSTPDIQLPEAPPVGLIESTRDCADRDQRGRLRGELG